MEPKVNGKFVTSPKVKIFKILPGSSLSWKSATCTFMKCFVHFSRASWARSLLSAAKGSFNNYVDKKRGRGVSKKSTLVKKELFHRFCLPFVHVDNKERYVKCPRLSTRGEWGVKIGSKLVHVVVEWPLSQCCLYSYFLCTSTSCWVESTFLLDSTMDQTLAASSPQQGIRPCQNWVDSYKSKTERQNIQ